MLCFWPERWLCRLSRLARCSMNEHLVFIEADSWLHRARDLVVQLAAGSVVPVNVAGARSAGFTWNITATLYRMQCLRRLATSFDGLLRSQPCRSYIFTPMVIERVQGGERSMDIWSLLLQKRVIFLHGEVIDEKANSIVAQLLYLESTNPEEPVELYINSPGGSVSAGLAIYDTMKYVNTPVHTFVAGQACSMGSLLLAAGEKGKRHSLQHSRIMLHQPLGGASGQASDILIQAKEIQKTKDTIIDIYADATGQSKDDLTKLLDRDHWLTAAEAVEFGVVDTVLDKREWSLAKT